MVGNDGLPGPNRPAGAFSAAAKSLPPSRTKSWSAAPYVRPAAVRLLQVPSTVRRPSGRTGLDTWLSPSPSREPQGPVALVVVATCASAILICLRMYARSDAVTVKPEPIGAACAAGAAT